jgi:putative flavoprotein involved in K+ transport
VDAPGVYVVGLPFLRRRKSSLIDGAGADARALSAHLEAYLAGRLQNGTPKDSGTSRAA